MAAAVVLAMLFVFVAAQAGAADGSPALISIADVSVTEGSAASPTNATLTITLSHAVASDVVVHYATSDGTAKQPGDYNLTTGDVTLAAGATSAPITIPVVGNGTPEDDKSFNVTLTLPDGADTTIAALDPDHSKAVVTIVDNDWTIKITPPNPAKAPENGGKLDFVVGLRNDLAAPANHKLAVDYKVTDDSAKLGTNYKLTDGIAASGTFTFAPGDTVKHIRITGLDDNIYGPDKTFKVTLSNPVGAKLASGSDQAQVGTITNTDAAPLVGISDCAAPVKAGTDVQFVVRTTAVSQLDATMHYTTIDDTTTADDYEHVTGGDVVIPAGQTSTTVVVHTKVNPPDGDRSFHVQLADPQNVTFLTPGASHAGCTIHDGSSGGGGGGGGGGSTQGSVAITGPDAVVEPPAGGSPVTVTFTVTYTPPAQQPPQPQPVTVNWATKDGTAKAPGDYVAANGTLDVDGRGDRPEDVHGQGQPRRHPASHDRRGLQRHDHGDQCDRLRQRVGRRDDPAGERDHLDPLGRRRVGRRGRRHDPGEGHALAGGDRAGDGALRDRGRHRRRRARLLGDERQSHVRARRGVEVGADPDHRQLDARARQDAHASPERRRRRHDRARRRRR